MNIKSRKKRKEKKGERERMMKSGLIRESFRWRI
jgi:hypothetical protein